MEIDNEETGRSESSSASGKSEEDDECWECGSDPNRVEWVSCTLVQGQQAKDQVCKMHNRQIIHKSSLVAEVSNMKRYEFEALALIRRWVKAMRSSAEMDARCWRSNTASGIDRRGVNWMPQCRRFEWKAEWRSRMGEKSLHAVGRACFR